MRGESRRGPESWQVAALVAAGGAGALALANWMSRRSAGTVYSALDGEQAIFTWTYGGRPYDIAYKVKGRGMPLVLIHGVYAGASSFEYRQVFDTFAEQFRVYAFDLLGFGLSAHPPLIYTPILYESLIQDFITQVVGGVDHPVNVVASTLAAAFAIRAAAERPSLFERLVLIEPTGIENLADPTQTPGKRFTLALLRLPVVGTALCNLISSRLSIRFFLRQVYRDHRKITGALVDYYYAQAHQAAARFPIASFVSGRLNTPVHDFFALLKQPVLLVWGKDARLQPLERAQAFRQSNPRAELRVLDCGALPQDELPAEFVEEVGSWLRIPIRSGR
jgi:pimeloyl-ACP methyl ester carboxylesterase